MAQRPFLFIYFLPLQRWAFLDVGMGMFLGNVDRECSSAVMWQENGRFIRRVYFRHTRSPGGIPDTNDACTTNTRKPARAFACARSHAERARAHGHRGSSFRAWWVPTAPLPPPQCGPHPNSHHAAALPSLLHGPSCALRPPPLLCPPVHALLYPVPSSQPDAQHRRRLFVRTAHHAATLPPRTTTTAICCCPLRSLILSCCLPLPLSPPNSPSLIGVAACASPSRLCLKFELHVRRRRRLSERCLGLLADAAVAVAMCGHTHTHTRHVTR